jgi:hypothetical protein
MHEIIVNMYAGIFFSIVNGKTRAIGFFICKVVGIMMLAVFQDLPVSASAS